MLIPLSQGKFAEIDDEDYGLISKYTWSASKDCNTWYAVSNTPKGETGKRGHISMHRLIMGFPNVKVDHWDGDGLNNKRGNLRKASDLENAWNRRARRIEKSSRFKGVKLDTQKKRWACKICVDGKTYAVQPFDIEQEAAMAYDSMARYYFGEFAKTNFEGADKKSVYDIKQERIIESSKNKTSVFYGVHLRSENNKWVAQVNNGRKQIFIGYYDTEVEAALAYNEKAIVLERKIINDIENRKPILRRML